MTRFARARGSKASNERTPEEATPWFIMKRQLVDDKQKKETYSNIVSSHFMKEAVGNRFSNNLDTKLWEVFDSDVNESTVSKNDNNKKEFKKCLSTDLKKVGKRKSEKIVNCSNVAKEKLFIKGNKFTVSLKNNEDFTISNKNTLNNLNNNVIYSKQKNSTKGHSSDINGSSKSIESEVFDEFKNNQNILEKNKKPLKKGNSFKPADNNITNTENHELKEHNNKTKSEVSIKNTNLDRGDKNTKTKYYGFPSGKSPSNWGNSSIRVGGKIVEIADFHGFAVKKEDAQRLHKLRKDLILKGVPRKEVEVALKAERRRAEKALAREKKAVCFKCRKFGHNMSECPECDDPNGVCFKCGSTEHSVRDCRVVQNDSFKYAHCFICQEQGHIARQCPDNPRGLYPKGGACNVCGDVTHLKKDCPNLINEKEISTLTVGTVKNNYIEDLEEDLDESHGKRHCSKKTNLVKF